MDLLIDVQKTHLDSLETVVFDDQALKTAAETTLMLVPEGIPETAALVQPLALTIVITGDRLIRRLNAQFGGEDVVTDVLAFPAGLPDPDSGVLYLGDIIISYPQAASQASSAGHNVEAELQLLVVHGVLHLLGYDHHDLTSKERMWALQRRVLRALDNPAKPLAG